MIFNCSPAHIEHVHGLLKLLQKLCVCFSTHMTSAWFLEYHIPIHSLYYVLFSVLREFA